MKYEDIRKQLIKESGVIAAVVVVSVAVVYYLGVVGDRYQQESAALQGQVASARSETIRLQDQYNKVQKNSVLYQEAMEKNAGHQLAISRQAVREHFSTLRNRYYLNSMHLTMSPVKELAGSQYKRPTGGMESSEVNLSFEALSDEYVYGMIDAMQQELPGSSRITEMTLTHAQPLSDVALQTISQKGAFPLVTGDMQFTWFGITSKDSDNADAPPKK